ncbi:unnamed protein product, partial [Amoebophrya sp. A25]
SKKKKKQSEGDVKKPQGRSLGDEASLHDLAAALVGATSPKGGKRKLLSDSEDEGTPFDRDGDSDDASEDSSSDDDGYP